jgi:hypothetical protein
VNQLSKSKCRRQLISCQNGSFLNVAVVMHICDKWQLILHYTKTFAKCRTAKYASEAGLPDFSWYMIPKLEKMYQMNTKCIQWARHIPNVHKIFQMARKYFTIFQSQALQNLPKLGFLVWKQTIWQPCSEGFLERLNQLLLWLMFI